MAVYQISKIQIRRGRSGTGTGLPQLASGELAWSVDTAELWIGNGSVAEGAAQVGNTKILTEHDLLKSGGLLATSKYYYKGLPPSIAAEKTTQQVFDYNVYVDEFIGNSFGDKLQNAINQLYLLAESPASGTSNDSIASRVILHIPAGAYTITSTIYIPSYTTLVGEGKNNTIITFTGNGALFSFENESSTTTTHSPSATTVINRPKNITFKDFSVKLSQETNAKVMQLNAAYNCHFENLSLNGVWNNIFNASYSAINLTADSELITSENNHFKNIDITGFSYAMYAKHDIMNNTFDNINVSNCYAGFLLGVDATSAQGQVNGPRQTYITNCKFTNIKKQAIHINKGFGNIISNVKLSNIANDSDNYTPLYPEIFVNSFGNQITNITSDRHNTLSKDMSPYVAYRPEISGHCVYNDISPRNISCAQNAGYSLLLKLPIPTSILGTPTGNVVFTINYIYISSSNNFTRKGALSISADANNGNLQLSDEYDVAGISDSNSLLLDFKAVFLDEIGAIYTATPQNPDAIAIQYINTLQDDVGTFSYTYSSMF